jgi:hypothetical protein
MLAVGDNSPYITGPVSFRGNVHRPKNRRCRWTLADAGFVAVAAKRSLQKGLERAQRGRKKAE